MKILLLFLMVLFGTINGHAQNTSTPTILYPDLYEVIMIDPHSSFSMADLEKFCNEEGYELLVENFQIQLVRSHGSNLQVQIHKKQLPGQLEKYLGQDIHIQSIKYYGWEYLPSSYKMLFDPSKIAMKRKN
jgi:hypothetical protein